MIDAEWIESWETTVGGLKETAERMHHAREAGIANCRKVIQTSAKCIRQIHRHQFEQAALLLADARALADETRKALEPFPSVLYAGFLHDAEKEMVEAACVLALVKGDPLPSPEELRSMPMSYLNGVGEAASECRRFALDEMRKGRLSSAERLLEAMEAVYDELITFDYPDSMTGGLRRTCDALRAVVERTRADLTATASQKELVDELRAIRGHLPNKGPTAQS